VDKVVLACVPLEEESLMLASSSAHVIHFEIEQVSILAGAGKGVQGIKLEEGETCLGGAVLCKRRSYLVVEMNDGKTMEITPGRVERVNRGGKGYQMVKRKSFVRVLPPAITLADWEAVTAKEGKDKSSNNNGQKGLFE
jgi:DNA gyrase subunit A